MLYRRRRQEYITPIEHTLDCGFVAVVCVSPQARQWLPVLPTYRAAAATVWRKVRPTRSGRQRGRTPAIALSPSVLGIGGIRILAAG